mmetsp:Transcript_16738/g.16831  ORF Transcript_16738/g.16831 Transcript_16738/m.16831 type:complete len:712 (+) Transcript_16738:80-2215(+)|eukprot:CAMPEP_0182417012 /NCGR_PEP_ID=MMETSP1167-20130531/1450_1 /TAXON_ID=2988 /ORGANISM="Mallomonas Sp, Strain CCMP3275" /LENGTH=711 /DNA_ID=CAMNT_0024590279 /DNA_START=75 /DNA_END=2210 /DNA_ORIENTATION=+
MISLAFASVLVAFIASVTAECPNACSSHGKCGAFDMCICFRNWMANDCSERVCPFGLAHVDSPKGDLDSSGGALSGPGTTVVANSDLYPYGTTEQFPAMTNSQGDALTNTAHYYMECSNKGICDRATGDCLCFPGYEGSSCQRASCPSDPEGGGVCSGHGVCQTVQEYAEDDYDNIYELWDKDSSMICKCDPGYSGPDCSKRQCKYGFDPLYDDYKSTLRYSNWTYVIYTKTPTTVYGNYSITFYDAHGEDWQTDPIDINATCADVIMALESLPNKVVPKGSLRCYTDVSTYGQTDSLSTYFDAVIYLKARFWITFPQNPGKLKQIKINMHLDGSRPTLYTDEGSVSTLGSFVFADGFTGEDYDMVPDFCEGVTVTLTTGTSLGINNDVLGGLDTPTTKLLKKCLGDADGNSAQNAMANEVYNWDYGTIHNPHLIKLVDTTALPITNLCHSVNDYTTAGNTGLCYVPKSAGFYVTLYWDGSYFNLFNPVASMYSSSTTFYVFTTTGTLQMVSENVQAYSVIKGQPPMDRAENFHSNVMYTTNSSNFFSENIGNLDCETYGSYLNSSQGHLYTCLNKNDYVMVFNPVTNSSSYTSKAANPKYLNIYQLKKIFRDDKPEESLARGTDTGRARHQLKFDMGTNAVYSYGEIPDTYSSGFATMARVYKFTPPASGGIHYAGECSGRGICDTASGTCQCFPGYTNDDCSVQNAMAL